MLTNSNNITYEAQISFFPPHHTYFKKTTSYLWKSPKHLIVFLLCLRNRLWPFVWHIFFITVFLSHFLLFYTYLTEFKSNSRSEKSWSQNVWHEAFWSGLRCKYFYYCVLPILLLGGRLCMDVPDFCLANWYSFC